MTADECRAHVGAKVTWAGDGSRQGVIVPGGNYAVYVQFDGDPEPVSTHPRNVSLLAATPDPPQ
jgi:hypothetical protein